MISFFKNGKKPLDPQVAAERRVIYEATLNCRDPEKIKKMSAVFRAEGCTVEADMLDKRVALCETPPEVVKQRREVYRKLMACTDPRKVREGVEAFEAIGATGAAATLARYAAGLEDAAQIEAEGLHDEQKM